MTSLEIGRVVKPHGLRGEVIVELTTDRTERMAVDSVFESGGRVLRIDAARPHLGRWIVQFDGVDGRDSAESLRGAVLTAEPIEDPSAMWIHELIGSAVVDVGGASLGSVVSVEANPASDLLVLDGGALIPLRFVTDHAPGRLTVDLPTGLLEL
jgi:16S rRNA processing protein RimM